MSKKGYAGIGGLPGRILKHFLAGDPVVICEDCDQEQAILEIQGETDSFGFERVALCKACHEKFTPADATMHCSVGRCNNEGPASDFVVSRDWTEGSHGPVYDWCPKCWDAHQRMTDQETDEDRWDDEDSRDDGLTLRQRCDALRQRCDALWQQCDEDQEPECFRNTDCREYHFWVNLQRADFTDADCAGVDLRQRDMSGAILIIADFTKANLSEADLSIAIMRSVRLSHANLTEADLTGADLERAIAVRADFSKAQLVKARLSGADLTGADLTSARLIGAEMPGAVLKGAVLKKALLAEAQLPKVDLTGADLTGADFGYANLRGADLRGAILDSASFHGALLKDAVFDPGVSIINGKAVHKDR